MTDPKRTPHVHAAIIKAWADGAEIECFHKVKSTWMAVGGPIWLTDNEYRVKPEPHKWQKEMDAFNAGKTVQFRNSQYKGEWTTMVLSQKLGYGWHDPYEYRIKPEVVVHYQPVLRNGADDTYTSLASANEVWPVTPASAHFGWMRVTTEEGKLVKAEVI